jgi:hypothetical protein
VSEKFLPLQFFVPTAEQPFFDDIVQGAANLFQTARHTARTVEHLHQKK